MDFFKVLALVLALSCPAVMGGYKRENDLLITAKYALCWQQIRDIICGEGLGPFWYIWVDPACPMVAPRPFQVVESTKPSYGYYPSSYPILRTLDYERSGYGGKYETPVAPPKQISEADVDTCTKSVTRKVCDGVEDEYWTYIADNYGGVCNQSPPYPASMGKEYKSPSSYYGGGEDKPRKPYYSAPEPKPYNLPFYFF